MVRYVTDRQHRIAQFLGEGDQRINEAEAFAACILLFTFADLMRGGSLSLWIDSTAAEGTLRRGYSSSPLLCAIAGAFWICAERHGIAVWIGRVPSALNPADSVSRQDLNVVEHFGAVLVTPRAPKPGDWAFLLDAELLKRGVPVPTYEQYQ